MKLCLIQTLSVPSGPCSTLQNLNTFDGKKRELSVVVLVISANTVSTTASSKVISVKGEEMLRTSPPIYMKYEDFLKEAARATTHKEIL